MIRAVFFDMGGTLDGDGLHWLDRFVGLYAGVGLELPREMVRRAFDAAERRAATDETIATAHLEEMIDRHVGWQLEALEPQSDAVRTRGAELRERVTRGFADAVRRAADRNVTLLAGLAGRHLQLGVVSNGCGNVSVLCDDLHYSPYLSLIVDSRRVGLSKPDPAIYTYAANRIGLPPASILMVGDSFERDVQPAKAAGMRTAWLAGSDDRFCPDPSAVDVILRTLSDVSSALDTQSRTVA